MYAHNLFLLALTALSAMNNAKEVRFPVKKNYGPITRKHKSHVDGELLFELTNEAYYYSVDVVLGSNNQTITALLDTGSSDLWVPGVDSSGVNACESYLEKAGYYSARNTTEVFTEIQTIEGNCNSSGTFDPSKSTTFKKEKPNIPLYDVYGDYTFAEGYWGSDTLYVNGIQVDSLLFGVAEISNSSSVCGISFIYDESSYANFSIADNSSTGNVPLIYLNTSADDAFTYKNLPYIIKDQGLVDRVSYSLFLNYLNAIDGDLLFGSIDTKKYKDNLSTIPLVNIYPEIYNNPSQFSVTLQGIGFVDEHGNTKTFNQQFIPAVVDSGTTDLRVPNELLDIIVDNLNATYNEDLVSYTVQCPTDDEMYKGAFVMQFGGENYFFPYANFVAPFDDDTCMLQILSSEASFAVLGDVVLSSLYVVYDLENYEISFARANYDGADSSDIQRIPPANTTIDLATKAPGYSSTWVSNPATLTSGGDIFNQSTSVKNPWASTPTKYMNPSLTTTNDSATTSVSSSGTAAGYSTDNVASMNSGSTTISSSSKSSSKSKNGANAVGFSFVGLLAALFV